jgi:hypothetical protein
MFEKWNRFLAEVLNKEPPQEGESVRDKRQVRENGEKQKEK